MNNVSKIQNLMKNLIILSLLSLLSLRGFTKVPEIVLVERGRSDYQIVIPAKASPQEKQAASILHDYLKKISKADIPIVTDNKTDYSHEILIGNTNRTNTKNPQILVPMLKHDGYWIKTSGEKLLIYGSNDNAVIYGVTGFLQDYLGCRKLSPTVERIPTQPTIRLKSIDDIQVPPVNIRIVNGPMFEDVSYRHWMKLQTIEDLWGTKGSDRYYVHTFDRLVPPSEYFKSHPEYYSVINGERVSWGQLCLSNQDLVGICVNKLKEVMSRNPEIQYWSVSQNDNYYHCECDQCRHTDSIEGSPAGTLLRFVNRIADSFPEKTITTLAYQYTRKPPVITKPAENVLITLCSIELNRSKPIETDSTSAGFRQEIIDWGKISDNIKIWDYEVQFSNYYCPFPLFHTLQPNIQFFNKNGAMAHFQQCNISKGVEFAELKAYLLAKLLWNPDMDVDVIINDFMKNYYEEAAPHIRDYFDLLHKEAKKSGQGLDIYGSPVLNATTFLSEGNLKKYTDIFEKAEKAVMDKPDILERVKIARLPVMFAAIEIAKTDLFGPLGFYKEQNKTFVLIPEKRSLLEDFYQTCKRNKLANMNENGLTWETWYKNTLRFIDVQVEGNLAFHKPVVCEPSPAPQYTHLGPSMLTNGVCGTEEYKINWLGWEGIDPTITVDLGDNITINELTISSLQDPKSWILHPQRVSCLISEDGKTYTLAATETIGSDLRKESPIRMYRFKTNGKKARYARFLVNGTKILPDWHPYRGNKCWVFIDEITMK